MSNKSLLLHMGSLNCNSLVKAQQPSKQSSFIRYIRSLHQNILSFQETHITDACRKTIDLQLQSLQSHWTYYCGIVSMSSEFSLSPNIVQDNERIILCKVSNPTNRFEPFYILNIYAPSDNDRNRKEFFISVLRRLNHHLSIDELNRLFIMGDFNYSYDRPNIHHHTSSPWLTFLSENFTNVMTLSNSNHIRYQEPISIVSMRTGPITPCYKCNVP